MLRIANEAVEKLWPLLVAGTRTHLSGCNCAWHTYNFYFSSL